MPRDTTWSRSRFHQCGRSIARVLAALVHGFIDQRAFSELDFAVFEDALRALLPSSKSAAHFAGRTWTFGRSASLSNRASGR